MCLIVDSSKEFVKTDKDIICYKAVYGSEVDLGNGKEIRFITPYFRMYVEIGNHYKSSAEPYFKYLYKDYLRDIWPKMLYGGAYHSFAHIEDAREEAECLFAGNYENVYIVECVIPAGSEYIEGTYQNPIDRDVPCYGSKEIVYKSMVEVFGAETTEVKVKEL